MSFGSGAKAQGPSNTTNILSVVGDWNASGFTKVTVLDEGLGVWHAKKYPVSPSEAPPP